MACCSSSITPLLCLLYTVSLAHADVDTMLIFHDCGNFGNFSSASSFSSTLDSFLSSLRLHASSSLYHSANFTSSASLPTVYAMFQCRGDKTFPECSACVSAAINTTAQWCPTSIVGRVALADCTLMYQNETITANSYTTTWSLANTNNNTDSTFQSNRNTALATVSEAAPQSRLFYSATFVGDSITEKVYAVAQCSGYLAQVDCSSCLSQVDDVQRILGNAVGGRVYYGTNCYYRFESYLFYAEATVPAPSPPEQPTPASSSKGGSVRKRAVIGSVLGSCLSVAVFCITLGFCMRKTPKRETSRSSTGQSSLELQPDMEQVRFFSLEELEKATRNFHDENKLGQGGFGSVYKGVLENGQFLAIKKLSQPSHHGERRFVNEVKLLMSVQHRNLIKLIGCCIEGSQRHLIFEYVPNRSLDMHLFQAERSRCLNWSTRRHIILGTAKGLAYLHEDSQVRIVHRDIKAANILLDDNFNPKVADFGLARLFSSEQTHATASVAGTLGYLAPEYAMHGQLTEKADIFSYGLVVLEILSGRRNIDASLPADRQRLLQWTWKLYGEQRQLELIDPLLRDDYFAEEAIRMVHVALLCTQAVAGLRPAMSKVVMLLMGRSEILDIPTSPPLVDSSIAELGSQTATSSDHHGVYVPPIGSNVVQSPPSSGSGSVYTPLMPRRTEASVGSISDVVEPR